MKNFPGVLKWKKMFFLGGGGEVKFFFTMEFFVRKILLGSWNAKTKQNLGGGGGVGGALGPHLGVTLGRKTIHFFLWPWSTHDWWKFWYDPSWRSKVIILKTWRSKVIVRKPWRRKNFFFFFFFTKPWWGMPNYTHIDSRYCPLANHIE